jgi:16S rRNA A1518/A1519 N6-dimethyltransferase RsmA/KsgA/DIM1 with predicted DNA glycosylase/AP lyase activity
VNRLHGWLCRSARWQKTIQQRVPWVLSGADLGQNVLELGPGPGLTTDWLRLTVQHPTIEIDSKLADALRSRLHGSNVEVVTGDATAMPFAEGQFSGGFRSPCCIMCLLQNCKTDFSAKCGAF